MTVLGVAAGTGLLPGERGDVAAATPEDSSSLGGVIADLPDRGVGPLSYAYKTFCPVKRAVPKNCSNGNGEWSPAMVRPTTCLRRWACSASRPMSRWRSPGTVA